MGANGGLFIGAPGVRAQRMIRKRVSWCPGEVPREP